MISKEKQKQLALALRKKGHSYSLIKKEVHVSKSTLSIWLKDFPLSKAEINQLRGKNPQRIERFRNTMRIKREASEAASFAQVTKDLGLFSMREKILAGFFLYWGEGTKAAPSTVALTNTDPEALKFFVHWLGLLGVTKDKMVVVLHLYKDMDAKKEVKFWSGELDIPISRFRKPYIKNTRLCDITYRSGFGHGTCSVMYLNAGLYNYVKAGLKYIRTRA